MAPSDIWEPLTLSVTVGGSVLAIAGICRQCVAADFCGQAKSVVMSLQSYVVKGSSNLQQREVTHAIEEKMDAARLKHFRACVQVLCLAITVLSMMVALNTLLGVPRNNTLLQDGLAVAGQLYSALILIWPRALTARNLDVHYFVLVLMYCAAIMPYICNAKGLLQSMLFTNAGMALLNASRRTVSSQRCPLLFVANCCFFCCIASSIITLGADLFTLPLVVVALELIFVCLTCVGALSLEKGFRAIVFQGMQLEEVKEVHAAAYAVLKSYCEVVVELDAEGYMDSSANLSSFLLKNHRQLQKVRLDDFIASEEERELFRGRLRASMLQKTGIAESVQVTMKDGCNNALRLEMMWFQFRRLGGSVHFMLGIREFSDEPAHRNRNIPARIAPCEQQEPEGSSSDANSEGLMATRSYCSPVPEELTINSEDNQDLDTLPILMVDATQPGMPIQGVTTAFCAQVGRLPLHSPVTKFIKKPSRFLAWMQKSLNSFATGDDESLQFVVTLQMPNGRTLRTLLRLVSVDEGDEKEVDLQFVGLLVRHTSLRGHCARRERPATSGCLKGTPCAPESEKAAPPQKAVTL